MRYAWPLTCLASSVVFAVASCGGSGATTTDGGGGFTSASGSEGSANGGSGSGTKSNSASSFVGTGTGSGGGTGEGGGPTCPTATTCEAQHADCGQIADGCNGLLTCGMGSTCPNPGDSCGGGGTPNKCGHATCTPGGQELCTTPGFNCGDVSDGCAGTVHCGDCTGNQTCGANGMPNVCGSGTCVPITDCTSLGVDCGMQSDGCGGQIDCGTCSAPNICGAVTPSVCGLPPCTPKSCSDQGIGCGPASDQCNNVIDCGGCSLPNTCTGNPSTCSIPASCTGLCQDQVSCPPGNTPPTSQLSGTVYAPNGVDPLPNVLVYVPNGPVQPFTPGVTCDNCSSSVTGNPLVSTTTDVQGHFTLTNIPVPDSIDSPNAMNTIPVVIQTGRWRRQITVSNVQSCIDNQIPTTACSGTGVNCPTRLPRNKGEGDIPHMAFSTGSVDALECVMRKIGVDDAEFTAPTGNGRIHLYTASLDGGAHVGQTPTLQTTLFASQAAIDAYDMVLFPCVGAEHDQTAADQAKLIAYANAGGRVFATHYSYVWLFNDAPFSGTAVWDVGQAQPTPDPGTGYIDMTFPKGQELAQWLQVVLPQPPPPLGQIQIAVLRHDFDQVIAPSQPWMYAEAPNGPTMHYTFNTPTNATPDNQCGRVLFDDFHVEDAVTDGTCGNVHCYNATGTQITGNCGADGAACGTGGTCHRGCSVGGFCPTGSASGATCGKSFPTECAAGAMTPQEKLLEFMLFDLGSCVTPDQPTCTPSSCMDLGIGCGPAGDGCGNLQQCGNCPAGQTCGGGGNPGQCGTPQCTQLTCLDLGIGCGPAGDGCGGQLDCGSCTPPATCGGGGNPGHCGTGSCTPETCTQLGIHCGPAGDGCGNTIQCGTCPAGQTCGGGGMPGVCGSNCTKLTCAGLGYDCGLAGDGCGGQLSCGTCSPPQTCGGGGMPNVCGGAGPH